MKCIKNANEVRKVKDEEADVMVKNGWVYCPKSEYKKVHGKNKVENVIEVEGEEVIKKAKKSKGIKMGKAERMELRKSKESKK